MLSVSKAMSAGDASSYFGKEDYYLKGGESSQWLGAGAETLGLDGVVEKDPFLNICNGKSPDGKDQLVAPKITKDEQGNQVESHRAGNDLTFSAPKSVSVAYAAGVDGIKDIHDAAVKAVMEHVEKHYSQARTPEGIQNGKLIAAKFDHVTSRAIDPQLHSHCFVENMTQTPDGQWRANEPKNIFVDQKSLGMLYRQELMHILQKAGYEIQFTDREQMFYEIKGVDPKLIEEFSSRRQAIEEKVAEWKASGEHKGVYEAKLFEMAALNTRDRKIEISKEDVVRKWDQGFEAAGTSREEVRNALGMSREQNLEARQLHPPEPGKSADEVTKQAAAFLTDKEAVMDRAQLFKTASQISGGQHAIAELIAAIDGPKGKDNGIERLGLETHGREAGKEFYTTTAMRELEARNVEALKSLGEFKSVTTRAEVEAYLSGLGREKESALTPEQIQHMPAYLAGLASAEKQATEKHDGRVMLTPGQREHVLNELAGDKGFAVTQGDPGTGKTFASEIVERFNTEVLEPSGRGHYTLNVAYTGKAAMEMSAASGKPAFTIDSFLNRYHAGKIRIDTSNQVKQENQATMAQAVTISGAAEQHADGMQASGESRFTADKPVEKAEGSPDIRLMHQERTADSATITKSSVWGSIAKGTTTAIHPDGQIIETKWEGQGRAEHFSVLKSSIREIRDPKVAEKQLAETGKRDFIGVVNLSPREAQISPLTGERLEKHADGRGRNEQALQPENAKPENGIVVPNGSQVVIKVDEASFVGAQQAEHLMNVVKDLKAQGIEVKLEPIGDTKQMQGIQAGPFFQQACELAKEGYGNYAALKEISRQKDNPELLKVAETLNRDGDNKQLGTNAVEALGMLSRQSRVTEISDRQELVQATVARYLDEASKPNPNIEKAAAGERQSVLLVTPLNADRHELNHEIREARLAAGEIERGQTYEILTTARTGVTSEYYAAGQVVHFSGERGEDGKMRALKGTRLNADGVVLSTDLEKNTVTVRYEMDKRDSATGEMVTKNVTATLDATEMATKTALYNREEREFSQGDQIVLLKNDKELGVENGNTGVIKSLDPEGNIKIQLESGREVSFSFADYSNIDHGYAVTVHKSQGATVDSAIMFAYLKPGSENYKSVLESMSGVKMTTEQYGQWNTTVSAFEQSFQADVKIGEHSGSMEFALLQDRRDEAAGYQKGIAIHFQDGRAMVEDQDTRMQMREAGMYWSPELTSWVTSVTNDKAADLMDSHPLKDPEYVENLKQEFAGKELKDAFSVAAMEATAPGEAVKTAGIDSTAEMERFGRASYNNINVALTRARNEAHVMTNSVNGLEQAIQTVDEKSTTIGKKTEIAAELFGASRGAELAEKIDEFEKTGQVEKPAEIEVDALAQNILEFQEELKEAPLEPIDVPGQEIENQEQAQEQDREDSRQNEINVDQVQNVELEL